MTVAYALLVVAIAIGGYAFVGYPVLLRVAAALRRPAAEDGGESEWPSVTVTLTAYNEEAQMAGALDSLLALDYPTELRRVLIVSDGSTDGTDRIVRSYAARGVDLIALPDRVGKTAAEGAALREIDTDLVLNTDASVRPHPASLKALVGAFRDPSVGVASGRDVSVSGDEHAGNEGERGYVGYEMAVRALETRVHGIVGASGSCYLIRASLHRLALPAGLSRDFAAALRAREHGYRAVSVDTATCQVPRAASLRREYRRKVRTMVRGMRTLAYNSALLNPARYGVFAWMLWSHKVARWVVPWAALAALAATALLAVTQTWARLAVAGAIGLGLITALAWLRDGRVPRPFALPAWAALGNLAAVHAALKALGGEQSAIWEPTRRDPTATVEAA
ncbi:MAG: glycosyltransferase [Gemmatimonadota bacterium]